MLVARNKYQSTGLLLLCAVMTFSVYAGSAQKISEYSKSGESSSLNNGSAEQLTDYEKSLAKQWMLKDSDWVKYKQIMAGPRGIWSPDIDPITALGVSETVESERRRYAEIWIRVERRRAELELAFEVERMKAGKRINGDEQIVKNKSWIAKWEKDRKAYKQQIVLFADAKCTRDCEEKVAQILASVGDRSRLDVFFRTGANVEEIGEWATYMKIPPGVVKSKKITLNFDDGEFAKMGVSTKGLPVVKVIDLDSGETIKTY